MSAPERYYWDGASLAPTKPGERRTFTVTSRKSGTVMIRFDDNAARSSITEAKLAKLERVTEAP